MAQVLNPQQIYFCHQCEREIVPTPDYLCPICHTGFIEELNDHPVNNDPMNNNMAHFFQGLLSSMPQDNQLVHQSQNVRSNQPITIFRYSYPPRSSNTSTNGNVFNFQGLLEQILDWVGTDNAVFRYDPSGLFTYVEYAGGNQNNLFGRNPQDYAWGPGALEQIMEQLFNQIEGQGVPPASKETLDKLPTVIINENDIKHEVQCSVCMEYFKIKERVTALPCEHLFHKDCITPWLNMHGNCPICRMPVGPESKGDNSDNASYSPFNLDLTNQTSSHLSPGGISPQARNTYINENRHERSQQPYPPQNYSASPPSAQPVRFTNDPNAPTQHFRFHYYPPSSIPRPSSHGIREPIPPPRAGYSNLSTSAPRQPSYVRSFSMNPSSNNYFANSQAQPVPSNAVSGTNRPRNSVPLNPPLSQVSPTTRIIPVRIDHPYANDDNLYQPHPNSSTYNVPRGLQTLPNRAQTPYQDVRLINQNNNYDRQPAIDGPVSIIRGNEAEISAHPSHTDISLNEGSINSTNNNNYDNNSIKRNQNLSKNSPNPPKPCEVKKSKLMDLDCD